MNDVRFSKPIGPFGSTRSNVGDKAWTRMSPTTTSPALATPKAEAASSDERNMAATDTGRYTETHAQQEKHNDEPVPEIAKQNSHVTSKSLTYPKTRVLGVLVVPKQRTRVHDEQDGNLEYSPRQQQWGAYATRGTALAPRPPTARLGAVSTLAVQFGCVLMMDGL